MIAEYETEKEIIFLIRGIIEVRIEKDTYKRLSKRYSKEEIIQFSEEKRVIHHTTKRNLIYVTRESQIPLIGHPAFGLIDRGTNLIQIRPITGCNLNCIFCSVDEGIKSRTKANDFIVEPDYLIEEYRKIAEFKGKGVEAHIDGQAEPFLYPYMVELISALKKIKETDVVSVQTNGVFLREEIIDELEGKLDRINLSMSTLDHKKAERIYGMKYPTERLKNLARYIAESKIDLLLAPVWLPGINDRDIIDIIEFAIEIGAGKRWPPLGIQKYIPYRGGRKLKRVMSFKKFYDELRKLEREYGIKLVLSPKDFGIEKRKRIPLEISKGEVYRAKIIADGRGFGEKIVSVKNKAVTVVTNKRVGEYVKFRITRARDGLYMGEEI